MLRKCRTEKKRRKNSIELYWRIKAEFLYFEKSSAIKAARETNEFFLIEKVLLLSSSDKNMYSS